MFLSFDFFAQENILHLKSGKVSLSHDINIIRTNEHNYHFLLFAHLPTNLIKEKIKLLGIDFLEYIPKKAYVVSISKESNISIFLSVRASTKRI